MTTDDPRYRELQERFKNMSDEKLIAAFNREVGNAGWTSYRASYLAALHAEFDSRGYDYSDIGDEASFSLKWRVKLINKKLVVDPSKVEDGR